MNAEMAICAATETSTGIQGMSPSYCKLPFAVPLLISR